MAQRTSVPASDFIIVQKSRKFGSLGRKNFFPGQGEKFGASDDDDTDDSGVIYFCRSGAIY